MAWPCCWEMGLWGPLPLLLGKAQPRTQPLKAGGEGAGQERPHMVPSTAPALRFTGHFPLAPEWPLATK